MGLNGVFLAVARDAVVLVRRTTLFLLQVDAQGKVQKQAVALELLTEEMPPQQPEEKHNGQVPTSHPKRITALEFFHTKGTLFSLLLLVGERRLVHYEIDAAAGTLQLQSTRDVRRSAYCMVRARVGDEHDVVLVGEKTGEAIAMPFPAIASDLKTLLGHTTSMITHMGVNAQSSLLLTADRDEKIRVSCFPRTSLIQSYCLGHTASLTKLCCSTRTHELFISTALDNSIKLWNMTSGALLASQPLLPESEQSDPKTLLNVSLAISPVSNVVVAIVDHRIVRLFAISASGDALDARDLPHEDLALLQANEPCEARFTSEGALAVSYKSAPFLKVFAVDASATRVTPVTQEEGITTQLKTDAASIELEVYSDEEQDLEEGGYQKKKVKTAESWAAKKASDAASVAASLAASKN